MPSTDWHDVVARLEDSIGPATHAQLDVAKRLDVVLPSNAPRPVVAAILRDRVRDALGEPHGGAPSEDQARYLAALAEETGLAIPEIDDREMADAWFRVAFTRRAIHALEALRPSPGDVVEFYGPEGARIYAEIASISDDGKLNFRGSPHLRARPHVVTLALRAEETSANDGPLYAARQYAAGRRVGVEHALGDRGSLEPWRVTGGVTPHAIAAVLDTLAQAEDEKPLQEILTRFPEVLAYTVDGHHGRWVLPHPRLAGEYVPDFFVASETSAGIRWTLIELESPAVARAIEDGSPRKELRHAIKQLNDWQEWLSNNLAKARGRVVDGGLGLTGIRSDARGVIIIGRGDVTSTTDVMRARWLPRGVEIRSYDWLVRAARFAQRSRFGLLDMETNSEDDESNWLA